MRFVTGAQKHISAFISHSEKNNDEAQYYEAFLRKEGFSAFQYGHGLHPGGQIQSVILEQIKKCHFFLFLVSDDSLNSEWVQRELGLAVELQKQNRGYQPIVIPLYAKSARWRETRIRPSKFPTRDFNSGELSDPFDLAAVRGLDKFSSRKADTDDTLVSLMKPRLLVTRLDDFGDEATFYEQQPFELYADLFPPIERDAPEDIVNWVLRGDVGEERTIVLPDRTSLTYKLDSRFYILSLAERAIGLAFTTFDHASKLIYGNYIGVQERWRGGDIAGAFLDEIVKIGAELFPSYQGFVFEVERFDPERVERIISQLEQVRTFASDGDRNEIRKFLRTAWYQSRKCFFFVAKDTGEPLVCTSPCLDCSGDPSQWRTMEEDYWLMWRNRPGTPLDIGAAAALWPKAVNAIYLEILAKSLVESAPRNGEQYWKYANAITDRILDRTRAAEITFDKFRYRHSDLLQRWMRLRIEIAI